MLCCLTSRILFLLLGLGDLFCIHSIKMKTQKARGRAVKTENEAWRFVVPHFRNYKWWKLKCQTVLINCFVCVRNQTALWKLELFWNKQEEREQPNILKLVCVNDDFYDTFHQSFALEYLIDNCVERKTLSRYAQSEIFLNF